MEINIQVDIPFMIDFLEAKMNETDWLIDKVIYKEIIKKLQTKSDENKDKIYMSIFNKEEIYNDCTVQVLTNTITGQTSIGWWRNER